MIASRINIVLEVTDSTSLEFIRFLTYSPSGHKQYDGTWKTFVDHIDCDQS